MRRLRKNTVFLIFFLLMVFLSPQVIRSFHHHIIEEPEAPEQGRVITTAHNGHCPICDYVFFVNDIPESRDEQPSEHFFAELILLPAEKIHVRLTVCQIPQRAPPSSPVLLPV